MYVIDRGLTATGGLFAGYVCASTGEEWNSV